LKYHVFVDFDGTATVDDVGYNFFKHFASGKAEDVVRRYQQGEISAVECLQTECDIYNENPAPAKEIDDFINSQELSAGFVQFIEFCRANRIKLTILSAGFDFYISHILKNHGLAYLEVYATPTVIKNGCIYPEFIYYDKNVCWQCANCKGKQIKQLTTGNEVSVFIGDGHSDSHGAQSADLVFAKGFLAEYLDKENIGYFDYDDFFDVISKFREILIKN
jgi:2-hydroxy-3-keto-5-methylthiopentenyl-1-phosphate phosphatase